MTDLRYSPIALMRRSAWMLFATVVVLIDYVLHADGGFPRVFGFGVVLSAGLIATALYLVGVTMLLTLGLMRHGGVALAAGEDGVTIRSAWFGRTIAWADIARIAVEVRYTKTSHHSVVAVHEASGVIRRHAVDVRLLADPPDRIAAWVDAAERERVVRGGALLAAGTGAAAGERTPWDYRRRGERYGGNIRQPFGRR